MAVPKKKTSKSKRNMRRSHDGLKTPGISLCPQCKEPKQAHRKHHPNVKVTARHRKTADGAKQNNQRQQDSTRDGDQH